MKARIILQRGNNNRTIILRDDSLLVIFRDHFEAESAYTHLKNKMKKDSWTSPVQENFVIGKIKKVRKSKIFGLPIKEKGDR